MMSATKPNAGQSMLDCAVAYARRGWHVFPLHSVRPDGSCTCKDGRDCASPGKHPRTGSGFKDASADPSIVARMWMRHPDANIGLSCGPSGLVAIDIDPRSQGDESLARFEAEHQPLPPTLTALTGGGGQHYLYQLGEEQQVRSANGWRRGVDVKSGGGYIVLAPSRHASGREYQWDVGAPEEPERLPAWLSALLAEDGFTAPKSAPQPPVAPVEGADPRGPIWHLFNNLGMLLGKDKRPGTWKVTCPWEHEHTGGKRGSREGGTVIFEGKIGEFFCQHDHCGGRAAADVRKLYRAHWDQACDDAGVPRDRKPGQADPPAPQAPVLLSESEDGTPGAPLELSLDRYGRPRATPANVAAILIGHQDWAGRLTWDCLRGAVMWRRPAPAVSGGLKPPRPGNELSDSDLTYISRWMAIHAGIECSTPMIAEACSTAAHALETDTLRDYLQGLRWDGQPRLATWLQDYCGVAPGVYASAVGRWWMISAVARALEPGCQCDYMLILQGYQGAHKSTAISIIGGEWYRAGLPPLREDVRASMALRGVWIVGIDELSALGGSTSETSKEYLTRRWDRYRTPYARTESHVPRRVCFAATTNEQAYLSDPTGARRYWPVRVGECDRAGLSAARDQLLAEAVDAWGAEDRHWPDPRLDPPELTQAIKDATDDAGTTDPWDYAIARLVPASPDYDWSTTTTDLLNLVEIPMDRRERKHEMRAGAILVKAGLERIRVGCGAGLRKYVYKFPQRRT